MGSPGHGDTHLRVHGTSLRQWAPDIVVSGILRLEGESYV